MASVSLSELHKNLRRYIDQARNGQEIAVTDRGRTVARIVAVAAAAAVNTDRLSKDEVVTTPARMPKQSPLPAPIKIAGTVSDLIREQRR